MADIPLLDTQRGGYGNSKVLAPEFRRPQEAYMVSRWLIEKATARLRRDGRTAARFTLHLSPMGAASIAGSIKCAPSQDTLTFMRINRGLWRAAWPKIRHMKLAMIGVNLTEVEMLSNRSGDLLRPLRPGELSRAERASKAADFINARFGAGTISLGATPRGGKNVYLNEGTPLIRSQNVRFEGFDWDGLAFISDEHADELRNVTVQTGDVLLNITGASIGRVCLAPEEMEGARVNQHVSIIRPRPQELDAHFVQHFLSSPMIQNWIWNENYGVTRQALTKGMIEEIGVPDVVIEEQREIVRRIETAFAKIDRLAAEAAKALKLLGRLDQRILAKAFAGDLVAQDPNDEPASVLLDRIREARATAPKKQRERRTKAYAMKEAPKDRLLADSATWPRNGLPFEDIASRVTMPHDELRDAIFELLGGEKPLLEQVFDTSEERMRLKRVAQ